MHQTMYIDKRYVRNDGLSIADHTTGSFCSLQEDMQWVGGAAEYHMCKFARLECLNKDLFDSPFSVIVQVT